MLFISPAFGIQETDESRHDNHRMATTRGKRTYKPILVQVLESKTKHIYVYDLRDELSYI